MQKYIYMAARPNSANFHLGLARVSAPVYFYINIMRVGLTLLYVRLILFWVLGVFIHFTWQTQQHCNNKNMNQQI